MASGDPSTPGWTPGGLGRPVELPEEDQQPDSWGQLRDFVRERLPESVRGARLDPGVRGALGIAGVALVAAVVAVILAVTSAASPAAPQPAAPKVAVPTLGPSSAAGASPAANSQAAGVVVDVAGKVRRPGLVKLAAGARVADAITAAGGVLPGTSTVGMSLARKVVDGEQLVVGGPQPAAGPAPASGAASNAGAGGIVDLNTASVSDLDALPGIGPVLAQRIVDWRTEHGDFTSVDQLREVSGVGDAKFADLSPLVRV